MLDALLSGRTNAGLKPLLVMAAVMQCDQVPNQVEADVGDATANVSLLARVASVELCRGEREAARRGALDSRQTALQAQLQLDAQ